MDEVWAQSLIGREIISRGSAEAAPYISGASRDAYHHAGHGTWRFAQAHRGWLENLGLLLDSLGHRSWIYREGKRDVYVLETSYQPQRIPDLSSDRTAAAFVAGYFDAEGGMPHSLEARLYVQFVQRDRGDLVVVRDALHRLGISCGDLHVPSKKVDPDYWRFFVRAASLRCFLTRVRSWHPSKRLRIENRLSATNGEAYGITATESSP